MVVGMEVGTEAVRMEVLRTEAAVVSAAAAASVTIVMMAMMVMVMALVWHVLSSLPDQKRVTCPDGRSPDLPIIAHEKDWRTPHGRECGESVEAAWGTWGNEGRRPVTENGEGDHVRHPPRQHACHSPTRQAPSWLASGRQVTRGPPSPVTMWRIRGFPCLGNRSPMPETIMQGEDMQGTDEGNPGERAWQERRQR